MGTLCVSWLPRLQEKDLDDWQSSAPSARCAASGHLLSFRGSWSEGTEFSHFKSGGAGVERGRDFLPSQARPLTTSASRVASPPVLSFLNLASLKDSRSFALRT